MFESYDTLDFITFFIIHIFKAIVLETGQVHFFLYRSQEKWPQLWLSHFSSVEASPQSSLIFIRCFCINSSIREGIWVTSKGGYGFLRLHANEE